MSEGIVRDNRIIQRTEPLITAKKLRARFLFGVEIVDNDGNEMPDETLQDYIDMSVSELEHDLDISIVRQEHIGPSFTPEGEIIPGGGAEEKDFQSNDYWQWGYFQLNNVPVIQVKEVRAVYPNANILSYPPEWYKLQRHDGILRLIPAAGTLSQFAVDAGGQYFPEIFRNNGHVPLVWQIDYISGFDDGKIPKDINAAIGLMAAIFALNIAGDLIVGAGIASESLSLDGLSQNVNTTSSAENHGYSAKVKEFQKQLFGESINSPNRGLVRKLRDYYQGQRINIV